MKIFRQEDFSTARNLGGSLLPWPETTTITWWLECW